MRRKILFDTSTAIHYTRINSRFSLLLTVHPFAIESPVFRQGVAAVGVDHSQYIEKLRDRQHKKVAERTMPDRMRRVALEPVEEFAQSLAEAGEISGFRAVDERFACAILVHPHMQALLSSGG